MTSGTPGLIYSMTLMVDSPHKGPIMQKAFPCYNIPVNLKPKSPPPHINHQWQVAPPASSIPRRSLPPIVRHYLLLKRPFHKQSLTNGNINSLFISNLQLSPVEIFSPFNTAEWHAWNTMEPCQWLGRVSLILMQSCRQCLILRRKTISTVL